MNNQVYFLCNTLGASFVVACFISDCGISDKRDNTSKPNFIIIIADDQGYNDLGCYGSKTIKTPRIDQMASEGLKMTSFYAQPVCGPSRGSLLTGRYPLRIGGGWLTRSEEITIAEMLKDAGYTTGCIGKWDISQRRYQEGIVPNDQGFDYYFGTLGANDMGSVVLYKNRDSLYRTNDMSVLTKMYTDTALQFIKEHRCEPFFLYLAHTMPHIIIDASFQFKGKSKGELYGDVIEEIDWNVGRIMELISELNLKETTYILYFSDNGPWSNIEERGRELHGGQLATGSAYPLRSTKGSPYEGGFRVPFILWGPGRVPKGKVCDEIMATLDILPTLATLAGIKEIHHRILDGIDQSDLITGKTKTSARDIFYYHIQNELQAVRKGKWKILLPDCKKRYNYVNDPLRTSPELYNLEEDISETNNLADEYPEVLKDILELVKTGPTDPS